MPELEESREQFHWIVREIMEGGGEACVCEARFVEGIGDREIIKLFQLARVAEYADIFSRIKDIGRDLRIGKSASGVMDRVSRVRQQFNDLKRIDFFPAHEQKKVELPLSRVETSLRRAPLHKR